MKQMYIDCGMGAAGDMLTAALLELMPDRDKAVDKLNAIGIPDVKYEAFNDEKCGVKGTHIRVTYKGEEEVTEDVHEHQHEHDGEHEHENAHHHHQHPHEHSHSHRNFGDVKNIVNRLSLPEDVKHDVVGVYDIIAEAESHAHGVPVNEVHFHEVGAMDAIADISAVCFLMNELSPEAVAVSDIHLGRGHVHCAHGIMEVPTPATAYIAEDLPTYSDEIEGELCTPTGAALLKYFGTEFGGRFGELIVAAEESGTLDSNGSDSGKFMERLSIGRGMGRKDFEKPNCVTVILVEK